MTVSSRPVLPSPLFRRVGVHHFTFEACSGFTRVTARRIAQSPKATFVTRLQHARLPEHVARQLPDLLSIIWMEPSSTGISRLRGALNNAGSKEGTQCRQIDPKTRLTAVLNGLGGESFLADISPACGKTESSNEAFPRSPQGNTTLSGWDYLVNDGVVNRMTWSMASCFLSTSSLVT